MVRTRIRRMLSSSFTASPGALMIGSRFLRSTVLLLPDFRLFCHSSRITASLIVRRLAAHCVFRMLCSALSKKSSRSQHVIFATSLWQISRIRESKLFALFLSFVCSNRFHRRAQAQAILLRKYLHRTHHQIHLKSLISNPKMNGTFVAVPPPYDLVPSVLHYPLYHVQAPSILSWISDKDLSLLAPIAVYWVASAVFEALDAAQLPFLEKYRIHEPEEVKRKNRVTKRTVFIAVIVQQVLQTLLGMYWLDAEDEGPASGKAHRAVMATYGAWISRIAFALLGPEKGTTLLRWKGQEMVSFSYWWLIPALQFLWASFVLDTWQYFWHRYFHTNKFLYKHIHSLHHRLYCPYAFGALYNHPVEGFILDSFGTAFAHWASLMTTRQAVLLFSFSTLKTVDDHCGCELSSERWRLEFQQYNC